MKYLFTLLIALLCLNGLFAQEKHFVFIQSENKQPFYVSLNGKLYSSTASGYVIIPKLVEGNYTLTVGFAQNVFPEQTFTTVIDKKDLGFEIKNLGEKGWALFNLQTFDLSTPTETNAGVVSKALTEVGRSNAPDPVINFPKKKPAQPQEKVMPDTVPEKTTHVVAATKDTASQDSTLTATVTPSVTEPVAPFNVDQKKERESATLSANPTVRKVSETANEDGVRLAYVEGNGKNTDTIHVVIPTSPNEGGSPPTKTITDSRVAENANQPVIVNEGASPKAKTGDPKFLDINMNGTTDTANAVSANTDSPKIMENSNCVNVATDDDYAKLRKRMAYETSDEKMIAEAKKYYRNKCFTTEQIRRLSTLFLSDEGRFKFFDASLVSVADASNYPKLEKEFIDPVFVTRFKSLFQ